MIGSGHGIMTIWASHAPAINRTGSEARRSRKRVMAGTTEMRGAWLDKLLHLTQ